MNILYHDRAILCINSFIIIMTHKSVISYFVRTNIGNSRPTIIPYFPTRKKLTARLAAS